jgi:hypothetical protein
VVKCPFGQDTHATAPEDNSGPDVVMMNVPPCAIDSTGHASSRS